jgi:hypothetical protein
MVACPSPAALYGNADDLNTRCDSGGAQHAQKRIVPASCGAIRVR